MAHPPPEEPGHGPDHGPDHDRPLVDELSSRLEQFRILYDSDESTDHILAELGGEGRVEREMLRELATTRTIAQPDKLFDAHALALRALEVLARNGARQPSALPAGILTSVAKPCVQQVIRFIVRSYQSQVYDSLRDLYSRRLAWMAASDPSRMTLVRARLDIERAMPAYKKKAGGLPAFVVGGAAVSSLTQGARGVAGAAGGSRVGIIVAAAVAFVLLAAVSWVVLRGAAIARRRIRLTMDRPLAALWQTVGWCGRPPRDPARAFAAVAIVLTAVGWLLIPLAAVLFFAVF